ncbi:uncharacterized protein [Haliotis cracherodii]|uniref:uncharacterized protein n=1 Tax=Haliotis cracherodii TaxID=6455 RepID=UPI0039EBE9C8
MSVLVLLVVWSSVSISSVDGKIIPSYREVEFLYSSNKVSWSTAWATCKEHSSSHLINIKNSVRNNALLHFFATADAAAMKGDMWTGLHYVQSVTGWEFVWSGCHPLNVSLDWPENEPGDPTVSRCVTSGKVALIPRTRACNSTFLFVCQRINGDCSYTDHKKKICDTKGRRAVLEGQLSHGECRDRCSVDTNGSDLCWAFEHVKSTSACTLIFSASPYACEAQVREDDTDSGSRNCFVFTDITGKKEKIVDSETPVSSCVTPTTMTPTTSTATSSLTTTVSQTSTQTSASSAATTEYRYTETATATTTTTPITTTTATSDSVVSTEQTSPGTSSTTHLSISTPSSAATTATTSTTTNIPSTATTATRDTDTPTSTPDTSTAASSSNSTGGVYTPSLTTYLSRLEATLASSTSASSPAVASLGRYVYEACVSVQTFTAAERKKRTDDMVEDLSLDKKNLSSYRRKKSSAADERPSAQHVGGGVAIMLLVTAALIIILPDCTSILMHAVHSIKKKQLVAAQQ